MTPPLIRGFLRLIMQDIHNDLIKWSIWSKNDPNKLNYPSMANFSRLSIPQNKKTLSKVIISDEYAVKIDKSIAVLSDDLNKVVVNRYLYGLKNQKIAELLNTNVHEVGRLLKTARRVIEHVVIYQ